VIRRLLLFVLLVAVGVWGLAQLTSDPAGGAGTGLVEDEDQGPSPFARDETAGRGVSVGGVDSRGETIAVTAQPSGRVEIPSRKRVPYGNGYRMLRTYQLDARDSRPLGDGEQLELIDLVVTWFEQGVDEDGAPIEIPAGELLAERGYIGVGKDDRGKPSIQEDRDMDLRVVTVRTLPSSTRFEPLEMEVAAVRGRQTEGGLLLYTPTENEPFTLQLGGARPARMTGRGVRLSVPPGVGGTGDADRSTPANGVLELDVRHDPVLVADGIEVRANGPLLWRERVSSRAARVTLDGRVRIRYDGARPSEGGADRGDAPAGSFTGLGDRFVATIARGQDDGGGSWRALELSGAEERAPGDALAELRRADGSVLTARRIVAVAPGGLIGSEPTSWTADGSDAHPVRLQIREPRPDGTFGEPVSFVARDRIRAFRIENLHRQAFATMIGPGLASRMPWPGAATEHFVFEGPTRVDVPDRELTLDCVDGMTAWLGTKGPARMVLRTPGTFDLASADVLAQGDRGFSLVRADGLVERLRLGPPATALAADGSDAPAFDLQRRQPENAADTGSVTIHGHGSCIVERSLVPAPDGTERPATLTIASPSADAVAVFENADGAGRIEHIANLRAALAAGGEIDELRATSAAKPCAIDLRLAGDQRLVGLATTITRLPSGRVRLLGSPAVLERGRDDPLDPDAAEIRAARIDVVRLAEQDDLALIAVDPAGANGVFAGRVDPDADGEAGQEVEHYSIRAPLLRYVPSRIPEAVARLHAGPAAAWFAPSLRSPRLIARAESPEVGALLGRDEPAPLTPVTLEHTAGDGRLLTLANGRSLEVRLPARTADAEMNDAEGAGVLTGSPARLERIDEDQRFIAVVERVRFGTIDETLAMEPIPVAAEEDEDAAEPLSTLFVFGFSDAADDRAARDARLRCRGPIDVRAHDIAFGGPVTIRGLDANGAVDPEGLDLRAETLHLVRDAEEGVVVSGTAEHDVEVRWNGVEAFADRVTLELREHRFLAESFPDGGDPVRVGLVDGVKSTMRRALVDYEARSWMLWRTRVIQRVSTRQRGRSNDAADTVEGDAP
jgi:hypothetical protein